MQVKLLNGIMVVLLLCAMGVLSVTSWKVSSGNGKLILIDPGHGGQDSGVVGIDGILEKDINLAIGKKLEKCLKKYGYKTIMTRREDKGLYDEKTINKKIQDMQNRVLMVKEYRPVLAISIHQNSYPDASVYGPQVFYYRDSQEGASLAKAIQESMNEKLNIKKPRTEKANSHYYLLKKSESVFNIVECAFLTNKDEVELIRTSEYQEQVAEAIAIGIRQYLEEFGKQGS